MGQDELVMADRQVVMVARRAGDGGKTRSSWGKTSW
jgi:hypothetical protein